MNNRGQGGYAIQVPGLSPMVKNLIILNVTVWVVGQLLLDRFVLGAPWISSLFSLTPKLFAEKFMVWQPLTYMFLHSSNSFHILFNMISLWFFGSDLEYRWGSRSFLTYYLVTGVGAALIYTLGVALYGAFRGFGNAAYLSPVIGASGAVFALLVAYGVLFGDRLIYFFGVFPMKAKIFVLILAGVEFVTLMNVGPGGSRVANLAHVGGMVSGLLFLWFWTRKRQGQRSHGKKSRKGRKGRRSLRLVVNNDHKKSGQDPDDPRYWN